jgi:hypothetical protein
MLRSPDALCKLNEQICPKCGARGSFTYHGQYRRSLVKLILSVCIEVSVSIKRLRCLSCKTTHAVIPFDVVPYCQHSTTLAAKVFYLRLTKGYCVWRVCLELGLSKATYYRIYHRSLNHLLMLTSAYKSLTSLTKDVSLLVAVHLKIHKTKPFESARLFPVYADP